MVSISNGNQLQYLSTATGEAVSLNINVRNGSHTVSSDLRSGGFEPSKVKHVERRNVICLLLSGVNIMIRARVLMTLHILLVQPELS